MDGRVSAGVDADVREQVVDCLPEPVTVACDDERAFAEFKGEDAVGLDCARGVDGCLGEVVEGDWNALQRAPVVQAGEQKEILDE